MDPSHEGVVNVASEIGGKDSLNGLVLGGLRGGGQGSIFFNPMYAGGFGAGLAESSGIGIIGLSSYSILKKSLGEMLKYVGIPDYAFSYGHTAVYVRVNGKIVMTRGFSPESLLEVIGRYKAVKEGSEAVQGVMANEDWMWSKLGAMTGEIELTAEEAMRILNAMPAEGRLASPSQYSAAFRAYLKRHPEVSPEDVSNCVLFGRSFIEKQTGVTVGQPVRDVEDTQAGIMQYLKRIEQEGGPLKVSRMPLKYKIVKWGGRSMAAIGYGMTAYELYEIAKGPANERGIRGTRLAGSLLGGLAAGSAACLLCGPGAPACLVVGGLAAGAVGSGLGEEVAGGAYDGWDKLWKTDWGVVLSGHFRTSFGVPWSLH